MSGYERTQRRRARRATPNGRIITRGKESRPKKREEQRRDGKQGNEGRAKRRTRARSEESKEGRKEWAERREAGSIADREDRRKTHKKGGYREETLTRLLCVPPLIPRPAEQAPHLPRPAQPSTVPTENTSPARAAANRASGGEEGVYEARDGGTAYVQCEGGGDQQRSDARQPQHGVPQGRQEPVRWPGRLSPSLSWSYAVVGMLLPEAAKGTALSAGSVGRNLTAPQDESAVRLCVRARMRPNSSDAGVGERGDAVRAREKSDSIPASSQIVVLLA
ncbi:hypothetical protein C8R44DRAFT_745203 [Mycena epipterygia]|nr:hypothetical protein C8R44DRAFT_745203 [Mycena epipterygia]